MTTLIDVWRAVDPAARLVAGDPEATTVIVRGVARTRAAAPHLPPIAAGQLLVVDATTVAVEPLSHLLIGVAEAGVEPAALLLAGMVERPVPAPDPTSLPVLASHLPAATLATAVASYLEDEAGALAALTAGLRLAGAEAALVDPTPAAPAGLVAAHLRRGVAVAADGELVALHARPAGQALAARFAALHARLLTAGPRSGGTRHTKDGLWIHEAPVRPGASVWLFDDLPLAAADRAAAEALTTTLRALLRRSAATAYQRDPADRQPPATGDPLTDTLLAVARANGRVAAAARALGVHRNTVLYRLRRARLELNVDPRRPQDALRLLRADEERRRG